MSAKSECLVTVTQGTLRGKICNSYDNKQYYSFEGIPYAKPPVGNLRFRDPQKPENWTGIWDATKPGNMCCQINPISNKLSGSEDCLYLNVYTPSLPREKNVNFPVIFFVHGGRYTFGYGDYYKPDYFIRHDVIIVTVNYRLSILGFLCLDIPEVPGNAGLKDTVMALRWVNENIQQFGGNLDNITVMGESAGACAVGTYMASKMTDGLFHKVICQSGSPITDNSLITGDDRIDNAKLVAAKLEMNLTNERDLYNYFRDVPVQDLLVAFTKAKMDRSSHLMVSFIVAVIEKKIDGVENYLDEHPRDVMARNGFKKVPLLTGVNSHEAAGFLQKDKGGNVIFVQDVQQLVPRHLASLLNDTNKVAEFETKVRAFYYNNQSIDITTKNQYVDLTSDRLFNFDMIQLADHASKHCPDVYVYIFQYLGGLNTKIMRSFDLKGACHGDMIQYQFYKKGKHDTCSESDKRMVDILTEALCNFARNGKPTWKGQTSPWQPYDSSMEHVLVIDDDIKCVKNPFSTRMKFWRSITNTNSNLSNSKL